MTVKIFIPERYKETADWMARRKTSDAGRPIFQTYMDVMVFAAMIGYQLGEKDVVESKDRGAEIDSDVFENRDKGGIAYLLSIHDKQEGDILRDERQQECWQILEGYAARGLREIESWLVDSATDVDGVNTLLNRMKDWAVSSSRDDARVDPDVEW